MKIGMNVIQKVLLLALLCVVATPAFAADYLVAPLALNLDVNKRDIIDDTITLINNEDRVVRLYASVNEVAVDGNGVVEKFVPPSQADRTNTPTTWIEITRGRIELQPGETREIPFTVRMNPNTKPGDYSVFIGFATGSNQPTATAKVMAGKAPGTIVNLSIDQEQNVFLRLERFIVDRFVTEEKGGAISYTLANPGRTDVIPKGEVIFYDNSGDEVAAVPLNAENTAVAASEDQRFELAVPESLGMGKYKAFLSVEYGEYLTASIHDTAFFYILPLKQLIIIFVILMLFAVGIALYIHRRYDPPAEALDYHAVPMYIKDGRSEDLHHDIDLKNNKDS